MIRVSNMSKELEAFESIMKIYGNTNSLEGTYNYFLIIKKALQRLEAIDNSKPSEALGLVKRTCELYVDSLKQRDLIGYDIIEKQINEALDSIKQTLIKSQKQEKVLEILKEKGVILSILEYSQVVEDYNNAILFSFKPSAYEMCKLTQEEFELLKRWIG